MAFTNNTNDEKIKNYENNIPDELKHKDNWILWKLMPPRKEGDHKGKLLFQVHSPKMPAKSNDPKTWASFDDAIKAFKQGGFTGIGFVFEKPYIGLDIDDLDSLDLDKLMPVLELVKDAYIEKSQSGNGYHAIFKGFLPANARNRSKDKHFEMYQDGRFFANTGELFGNKIQKLPTFDGPQMLKLIKAAVGVRQQSANQPAVNTSTGNSFSKIELVKLACKSKQSPNFEALMKGDTSNYGGDDSAADIALCDDLAFWTNKDPVKMDEIFRGSKLYRKKWDEKRGTTTYGQMTIQRAIDDTTNGFTDKSSRPTMNYKFDFNQPDKLTVKDWLFTNDKGQKVVNIPKFGDYLIQKYGSHWQVVEDQKDLGFWRYGLNSDPKTGKTQDLGYWNESNFEMLQAYVNLELNNQHVWKARTERQTIQYLRGKLKQHTITYDNLTAESNYLVNFRDKVLNMKDFSLLDHDPKYHFTGAVGYDIANADPDQVTKLENWLTETLGQDGALTLMEYIGYMFHPDYNPIQAFIMLYGQGSNGKDHILRLISLIVGEHYARHFSLKDLAGQDSRFNKIELAGKRVNVTSELNDEYKRHTVDAGAIKELTSGSPISGQRKNKKAQDFNQHAKLIFAVNDLPRFNDHSNGFVRRIYILKPKQIKGFEKKYDFGDQFEKVKDSELASFAVKCIKLYQDELQSQNNAEVSQMRLHETKQMKDDRLQYAKSNDTIQLYLDDNFAPLEDLNKNEFKNNWIDKGKLYFSYKKWCQYYGYYPENYTNFSKDITNKGHTRDRKVISGHKITIFYGLKRIMQHDSLPDTMTNPHDVINLPN